MAKKMTRIQWVKLASGKFEAVSSEQFKTIDSITFDDGRVADTRILPNSFGLAAHYTLTSEDVEMGRKNSGEAYDARVGDTIECGMWAVSNKPRVKYEKVTKRVNSKMYDTCQLKLSKQAKPGTVLRLEALQAYYENPENEGVSPFSCDMAELVSKSAIGKIFEEYTHTELEAELEEVA